MLSDVRQFHQLANEFFITIAYWVYYRVTFILLDYESKDSSHWHHHFIFKTRHYPTITATHTYNMHYNIHYNIRFMDHTNTIEHTTMRTLYTWHTPYTQTTHNLLQAAYTHTTYTTHVRTHILFCCPIIISQAEPPSSSWPCSLRDPPLLSIHQPCLASLATVVPPLNPRLTLTPPLSYPLFFTTVSYCLT